MRGWACPHLICLVENELQASSCPRLSLRAGTVSVEFSMANIVAGSFPTPATAIFLVPATAAVHVGDAVIALADTILVLVTSDPAQRSQILKLALARGGHTAVQGEGEHSRR